MICLVQTMNWWCGYVNWLMVMDHVEWCIDGTLTMLVEALGKYAWSWIHNRDSYTCTLGILSLSEDSSQDDVVQKALKQGVGWNYMSRLGSATNSLNSYKWSFTSKWWGWKLGEDVWYLTWLMEMILIGCDLSYSQRKGWA